MSGESGVPSARIDETVPSVARAYDYMLGGKEHFEVDRNLVDQIAGVFPQPGQLAWVNRRWMTRVVRFMARDLGIDQFLDVGSGLPTTENVHQIVARYQPNGTVVYVDHDPIVSAHGRALLEETARSWFVQGDLAEPDRLLANEAVAGVLDMDRPVGLVHAATLHWVDDARDPWAVMRRYRDLLPAGSVVAASHLYNPGGDDGAKADDIARRATDAGMPVTFRSRAQIESLFDGVELFEPGLVRLAEWWPEGPPTFHDPWDYVFLGAVGRLSSRGR